VIPTSHTLGGGLTQQAERFAKNATEIRESTRDIELMNSRLRYTFVFMFNVRNEEEGDKEK